MLESPTYIPLNDKMKMPNVGFGTWKVTNEDAPRVVQEALQAGYRLIDTATIYENEEGVGIGMKESSIKREEIFLATKVWNNMHGYDSTLRALDASLKKLKTDYVDLYHIHWPAPALDRYVPTWKALMRLHKEGLARSIGVCNFNIPHLERLIEETGIIPAVNQIELHPYFQQKELCDFHDKHGIVTEAWSPIARGAIFGDPLIVRLSEKYKKTPSQIVLRWHLEKRIVAIPKTSRMSRMLENLDIFNFALSTEDWREMEGLDKKGGRTGPDPLALNNL